MMVGLFTFKGEIMAGPKLLPEIGTGLGYRNKGKSELGFRGDTPTTKKSTPTEVVKPQSMEATDKTTKNKKERFSDVLKLRKDVLKQIKSGQPINEEDLLTQVQGAGISDPDAMEAILSPTLNDNVIKYFLGVTKNNTKQAKTLAKKFGFEV